MRLILLRKVLQKIANQHTLRGLTKLFHERLEGKIDELMFEMQAREILAGPDHFQAQTLMMDNLMRQTAASYHYGTPKNHVQSEALADTMHQKALNQMHLADYQARGTRLVQVQAVLDSKTTQHCKSMHGRIFRVDELAREDKNQAQLVRSNDFWQAANYFNGTPTHEVIPGLPPYHFNCRTRIVPYTDADAYADFEYMEAAHPRYATTLNAKLQNYELQPKHLPAIRDYASGSSWKKGSLQQHFGKHRSALGYPSATAYHDAALSLILSPNSSVLLRIEKNRLIMYVYTDYPTSKEPRKIVAVLDLDTHHLLSYSIKRSKQMDKKTDTSLDIKSIAFDAAEKQAKFIDKLIPDDGDELDSLEVAIEDYQDLPLLALYTDIPRIIRENDRDEMIVWADDISDWRMHTIERLILEDWLPEKDAKEISKVDKFILNTPVPEDYRPLQLWLKSHPF